MNDSGYTRSAYNAHRPYHEPPPVSFPRSQFANPSQAPSYRSNYGPPVPTYFSSPLRAPLNRQDRHDSLVEHQRAISHAHDDQTTYADPRYPYEPERTSYAFFEPRAMVDPLRIAKKPHQATSDIDRSDDESQSSQDQPDLVRKASVGHKAKPSLTNVKRSDSTQARKNSQEHRSPTLRVNTNINVLHPTLTAVPAASAPTTKSRTQPESPTSMYSQDLQNHHRTQLKFGNATTNNEHGLALVEETPYEELRTPVQTHSRSLSPLSGPTPQSGKSSSSTNPLLGLGISHHGMSSRVPEEKRPPKLNMQAIQDLESRGSMTSLPDLIRRATRLAANLDRGKTASRLGMWDMLGMPERAHPKARDSTFTDVLDAFPDPANSSSSKTPRPLTTWPGDPTDTTHVPEKHSSGSRKKARKCCGLSMMSFMIVLVVIVILVAAAVLIPIFLVAVPHQSQSSSTSLQHCSTSHACQNKGISIVDNNACSCVCVNGFTGSDCSQSADPNCVVADVTDGARTYDNATLGDAIPSLLLQASDKLHIPVNASVILSVFTNNNLSCAAENSLVHFDTNRRRTERRLLDLHGLETGVKRDLEARQTAYTSNEIVYQSSTTAVASATTSATSPSATAATNVTSTQVEFGQLVVLYVLAESRSPGTAVVAQQKIEQYFIAGALASGNSTVDVVHMDNMDITANFAELAIVLSNGKVIGGAPLNK